MPFKEKIIVRNILASRSTDLCWVREIKKNS